MESDKTKLDTSPVVNESALNLFVNFGVNVAIFFGHFSIHSPANLAIVRKGGDHGSTENPDLEVDHRENIQEGNFVDCRERYLTLSIQINHEGYGHSWND